MRYSADHKAATRKHLLEVTGSIAKKQGFSSTGVDALMNAAGVTSGAFYSHFSSKAELFKELVEQELALSLDKFAGNANELPVDEWVTKQLRRYLNWKHVQNPEDGCAVPSLAAEIARADIETRKKFEEAQDKIHAVWAEQLGDEKMAWAVLSQLIGSIVLARAVASETTGKKILEASKSFLESAISNTR